MRDLKTLCEQKRLSGAELTVKDFAEGVDYFEFSGVATTPKVDLVGDVVEPLGAEFSLPVTLLSKHEGAKPVGEVYFAKATKTGIPYKARIPKVVEPGIVQDRTNEAIHEIKYGLVKNVSIGFKAMRDFIEMLDNGLRFTKWRWVELSLTPVPANNEATITSFKSLDAELRAALGAQQQGNHGNEHKPRPGDSGQRSKGTKMQTLKQMTERREQVAARMTELNTGCGGDFGTLEETERNEFDNLTTELAEVDVGIRRQNAVELAAKGAVAITQSTGQDPASGNGRLLPREPKGPAPEKGIAFAQYLKMMGRAKGNPQHAYAMGQRAARDKAIDARALLLLKGVVEGGSVTGTPTAGNWGMELVGSESGAVADFAEFLRPTTILGKFGQGGIPALRRVPFRVPLVGMTSGGTGYWVAEGKGKPVTKFSFSRSHLDALKVAAMCVATMELLEDSDPSVDPLLRDNLAAALREVEDITFIDPNEGGTPGKTPASITNGANSQASSGADAAGVRADIKAVFGAFIADNNAPTSGVWVMSQQNALALSLMTNSLGQTEDFAKNITMNGGSFGGLPVITSEYCTGFGDSSGGIVVLINASDIYYGDTGGIKVDTSEHASVEMVDNPANDVVTPTASAYSVSMFQTNSVAFRAEQRLDWIRRRDSAVQVLTGVNWGA